MTDKKYRFYIERPVFFKKYEQIVIEADSEEEALRLCKEDDDSWASSDVTDYYDVDSFGEPEITDCEDLDDKRR